MQRVIELATLVSAFVAAAGVLIQLHFNQKQLNGFIFIEYTKRFGEVVCSFPPDTWQARRKRAEDLPPSTPDLRTAILRYLNLCGEELYLNDEGYLRWGVWKIWEVELKRTLRSPLVVREWPELKAEFDAYPRFQKYVESTMGGTT